MTPAPERLPEESVDVAPAPERFPEEPISGALELLPRRSTKALPAPGSEVIVIEDEPEEIPPHKAAKEYIRIGAFEEGGDFMEFDERTEEEEIVQLMEHTIEAEKLFMVSNMPLLIPSL